MVPSSLLSRGFQTVIKTATSAAVTPPKKIVQRCIEMHACAQEACAGACCGHQDSAASSKLVGVRMAKKVLMVCFEGDFELSPVARCMRINSNNGCSRATDSD